MWRLKQLDVYPKIHKDVTTKTISGAIVSIICTILIVLFVANEVYIWSTAEMATEVKIEAKNDKIKLSFDISFPYISCSSIAFDWRDDSYEIHPLPENLTLYTIQQNGDTVPFDFDYSLKRFERFDNSTGCRITGSDVISEMNGKFFFCPGSLIQADLGTRTLDFPVALHGSVDTTHTINRLTFGDTFDGAVMPLNGVTKRANEKGKVYQYFIQLVPTATSGSNVVRYQYAVTESENKSNGEARTPGVYFNYEVTPITLLQRSNRLPFLRLVIRCIAIICGVIAAAALADRIIFESVANVTQKVAKKA